MWSIWLYLALAYCAVWLVDSLKGIEMAGKPVQTTWEHRIDAIADDIVGWLEGGMSWKTINVRIIDKHEMHIGEASLRRWANSSDNRIALVARARAIGADTVAERTVDNAHDLVRDVALGLKGKEDIAAERVAQDSDRWIAGIWNKERYGQQTQAAVTVNIGTLHLDSLRSVAVPDRPMVASDVVDVEATLVPTSIADLL